MTTEPHLHSSCSPRASPPSKQYLDRSLQLAYDCDVNAHWDLWVATDSYADLPKAPGFRQPIPEATIPPLDNSFTSPWIGRTIEQCAKWLQNMPDDSGLQAEYFTAMNEFSREDDTVLTCRVRTGDNGEVEVDYYPLATKNIAMYMITNRDSKFDEAGETYQSRMKRAGKLDRSQGGPFH